MDEAWANGVKVFFEVMDPISASKYIGSTSLHSFCAVIEKHSSGNLLGALKLLEGITVRILIMLRMPLDQNPLAVKTFLRYLLGCAEPLNIDLSAYIRHHAKDKKRSIFLVSH